MVSMTFLVSMLGYIVTESTVNIFVLGGGGREGILVGIVSSSVLDGAG